MLWSISISFCREFEVDTGVLNAEDESGDLPATDVSF
jgi:hypothetical protein